MFPRQVFVLLLCFIGIITANVSNYANQFHVAFLRQYLPDSKIEMIVFTQSPTSVNFTVSSLNGFNYNGTTISTSPTTVDISSNLQVRESDYTYRNLGIYVASVQPISLVLVGYTTAPRSSYLAFPCYEQPTQEYVYYGIAHVSDLNMYYSQILLVGCRDNTTVTITPSQHVLLPFDPQLSGSSTINITAGSNHTIKLHSLQTLLIAATLVDLSGTRIVSNRPLTVVGGHDCSQVPKSASGCDPIAAQMPPTFNWGQQFMLTPLQGRDDGQMNKHKIVCSESNTIISVNCSVSGFQSYTLTLPGSIQVHDSRSNEYCSISCSNQCSVYQLAFNGGFSPQGPGDPLLMMVPPIKQYPHSVTFTTIPQIQNYYSLAVPSDTYYNGTVIVNNVLMTPQWSPIYSINGSIIGYGYTSTANGVYTISHSHINGVIYVSAYGFDESGGFGYLTGSNLDPLQYSSFIYPTFNSSFYDTNEGANEVTIDIVRDKNILTSTEIVVKTIAGNSNANAKGNVDYTSVYQTIVFLPGETHRTVNISILDDDYAEEMENFTTTIETIVNNVTVSIDNTTIEIKDNDNITIGFTNSTLTVIDREHVSLSVAVVSGRLQAGSIATVLLFMEDSKGQPILVNELNFHKGVKEISVVLNSSDISINFLPNKASLEPVKKLGAINTVLVPKLLSLTYTSMNTDITPSPSCVIMSTINSTVYMTSTVTVVSTLTVIPSTTPASTTLGSNANLISPFVGFTLLLTFFTQYFLLFN